MPKVIYSPRYRDYDFGQEHPFSPLRVDMVLDLLSELGHAVEIETPSPASTEALLSVHDSDFVKAVEEADAGYTAEAEHFGLGPGDTPVFPGIDRAARWLVGGTLHGASLIAGGKADKVLQLGGGLHHARRAQAAGFCVYNDLAVAIRHLVRQGLYVAYVDIDVHHGDGVQQLFYEDDHVLTISLHESGQYLFPGTGDVRETGRGPGNALSVNVPLEPFTEDESYLDAFERVVPAALSWFGPRVLVVQAGADAHYDDPLADMLLTTHAYETLFRRLLSLADEFAGGRVLFTLGGGYSVSATPRIWTILYLVLHGLDIPEALPATWVKRWEEASKTTLPRTLHDPPDLRQEVPRREEIVRQNRRIVDRLLDLMAPYWY